MGTTVGRIFDPKFHDMDELIVEEIGMSINDYLAARSPSSRSWDVGARLKRGAIISPEVGLWSILITVRLENLTTFICG